MIFENMDRIIFAGDSVTDMGSAQPVGEGLFDNMGHGYPRVIESLVTATYPELSIRFTNSGISGNTSKDLLARYERDVLSLNPQWVSICIGINDVWRQFDSPALTDQAVDPVEYEENLRTMIEQAKWLRRALSSARRTTWSRTRATLCVPECRNMWTSASALPKNTAAVL